MGGGGAKGANGKPAPSDKLSVYAGYSHIQKAHSGVTSGSAPACDAPLDLDLQTFDITVNPVNDKPSASDGSASVKGRKLKSERLLARSRVSVLLSSGVVAGFQGSGLSAQKPM